MWMWMWVWVRAGVDANIQVDKGKQTNKKQTNKHTDTQAGRRLFGVGPGCR
jgi:hypothetical protein